MKVNGISEKMDNQEMSGERLYQVNNSVSFSGKPLIGSDEFLNQMAETLGIIEK